MWLKTLKNKWVIIWWAICLITTIVLLFCSFFNYTLVIGWTVGFILALINCWINNVLNKRCLNKKKRLAFWRGIIKTSIFWLISLLILFTLIMINKYFQNIPFFKNELKVAFYPINIFTFLIGFTCGQMYQFKAQVLPSELKDAKNYR